MTVDFRRQDDYEEPFDDGEDPELARFPHGVRRRKISRAAARGAEKWLRKKEDEEAGPFRELARPRGLGIPEDLQSAFPPRRPDVAFKAGFFRTLWRLFRWIAGAAHFAGGVLWDRIRGADSEEQRAFRLRKTFEAMGTTFIKVGQQLSMRLDLLPYAYTKELAKMLDNVPPFPTEHAIKAVERATGKPLHETFSAFDPKPIGSASVACVYQAVLQCGDRVAVKVRRPKIGQRLAADMRALGWLVYLLELVLLRPGTTGNFLFELNIMLTEELDFVREARFTDLFRRRLRKIRQLRYCTSPRVYFQHSAVDVLVTEFVKGIWLTDVLAAYESGDPELQAPLDEMNIDRRTLARRILLISRYGNFESIFFHADLHPANILIKPNNEIVLIDFGSCGAFTKRELIAWRRLFDAQSFDDVGGMVQAALGVIEPLPAIDKDQFALRLEYVFWNDLYAIKSKNSEWWERISARLWIGFLKLAREFNIPMRLNTLRMIRAIMLADTIAARLDHDLDPYKEYRYYSKGAGRRARRRMRKRLRRILGPSKYIRIETGIESTLTLIYRVQRALHTVAYIRILPLIGKLATTAVQLLRTLIFVSLAAAAATAFLVLTGKRDSADLQAVLWEVLTNRYFLLFDLAIIIPALRRVWYRLNDPEYDRRR